jgi:hypothetical protein
MRQETVNIYTFSELSDTAKQKPRDWWRNKEFADPAWLREHLLSQLAAMQHRFDPTARIDSEFLKWTGYTDDGILADNWDGTGEVPSVGEIRAWYSAAWDADMRERMADSYVDAQIQANEYEFYEDGSLY